MPVGYTIELTETARRVYERILRQARACADAGDLVSSKVTEFKMVEEVLDRIIPHDPFAPQRALAGPLSGIFRIKQGRMRICYAGSSKQRKIVVLYISDTLRKEGDVRDPYSVLTRLVLSGEFNGVLDSLGLRRPRHR